MAGFIEGIGDEILWCLIALIVTILITLAWISTGIPPVDYYVWLVQMQIHPNRRIVQVLQVDNQEVNVFRSRPERRRSGAATEQELEAFMDDNGGDSDERNIIMTEEEVLEMVGTDGTQENGNENRGDDAEDGALAEQENNQVENTQNSLNADNVTNENDERQQRENCQAPNIENRKDSQNVDGKNRELAAVVTDSAYRFTAMEEGGGSEGRQLSNVKLKFLDDSQVIACTALESTVGQFKRRYFWESILAGKVVRLIYRGQLLRDDTRSLLSYGLHDQCVVHCHVSSTPYAQPSSSAANNNAPDNIASSPELGDINGGTAVAGVAAIAGAQSVPIHAAGQLTRRIIQTFRGRSIEDNRNDPILIRIRNVFLRTFRYTYNAIMGPDPGIAAMGGGTSLDAAADAAARGGWNQNHNPVGSLIGQHIHIIFIVKFVTLWTFVFLYPQYTDRFSLLLLIFLSIFFASILFSNTHRTNNNAVQA